MITEFRNQTYLYTRKGHCVFLQRIMERFLSGSLRAFQWEGARDVKIGANHWHTTAQLHCLPTNLPAVKTSKHFDRPAPTRPISTFVANTSLNDAAAILFFSRQKVCLFQHSWDFWEGGSAVFGTIGPFYESQHPLQAHAPSLLSAHFQRLCCCWLWSSSWE